MKVVPHNSPKHFWVTISNTLLSKKKHLNSLILGYILFIKAYKSLSFSQEQPSPGGCSSWCEASAARRQSAVLPASEESLQLLPAQQPARLWERGAVQPRQPRVWRGQQQQQQQQQQVLSGQPAVEQCRHAKDVSQLGHGHEAYGAHLWGPALLQVMQHQSHSFIL